MLIAQLLRVYSLSVLNATFYPLSAVLQSTGGTERMKVIPLLQHQQTSREAICCKESKPLLGTMTTMMEGKPLVQNKVGAHFHYLGFRVPHPGHLLPQTCQGSNLREGRWYIDQPPPLRRSMVI